MTLDMERMQALGLKDILEAKYSNEQAFQKAMSAKLRELTFQYLKGELQGVVDDGPQVKALRESLREMGIMDNFVKQQSQNGAWATYLELTLLAELVDANFAVKMTGGGKKPTILTADPSEDKPTILLHNAHNTHWSAQVDGVKRSTLGDGNCGYNAFALSLASLAPQKPILSSSITPELAAIADARFIRNQETQLLRSTISEAKEAEKAFKHAMANLPDSDRAKIEKQIHDDRLFALKLATSNLPDEEGVTSSSIPVSRTSMDYLARVQHELEKVPSPDDDEEGYSGPKIAS